MKLSQEEFNVIKARLIDWQWIKEVYNYKKDRYTYSLTDSGLVYYSTTLALLNTNRLFKGPVIPNEELVELRKTFVGGYSCVRFLTIDHHFIQKIGKVGNTKYALSPEGAQFMYVLTKLMCNKSRSENNSMAQRLLIIILQTIAVITLTTGKIITTQFDKQMTTLNNPNSSKKSKRYKK